MPTDPGRRERGVTYFEVLATATIIVILASAVMPLAKVTIKRQKELELRRDLRVLRTAIDDYQALAAPPKQMLGPLKLGSQGYPPDLETLVEGVKPVGQEQTKKWLRRIPVDPMTGKAEWGLRCYRDEPDSTSWCGDDVYDVYSKSEAKALDGTRYKQW